MKKLAFIMILMVLTLSSLGATDNLTATFTLQSTVSGLVIHGFIEGVKINFSLEPLFDFFFPDGWTGEELAPGEEVLFSQDLSLGPEDIEDFDFGEGTYEDVASYAFVSNSSTGVSVNFVISDFVHTLDSNIRVPWQLNVKKTTWGADMTVSEGVKNSGSNSHLILSTLDTSKIRWAYIKFDLIFEDDLMLIAGDYVATVTATVIAQ